MQKWIDIFNKYRTGINKYYFSLLVFSLLLLFGGDSSLFNRFAYDRKIRELEKEIKDYRKQIEENRQRLEDLRLDDESLEHYAREHFYMTKPAEDLFIITP